MEEQERGGGKRENTNNRSKVSKQENTLGKHGMKNEDKDEGKENRGGYAF